MRKIPFAFAKDIAKMLKSGTEGIKGGEIANKKALSEFVSERLVTQRRVTKTRSTYRISDLKDLYTYLFNVYGIKDLDEYIKTMENKDATRSDLLRVSTRDKEKQVGTQTGIYLKCTFALKVGENTTFPENAHIDGFSYFLTDYSQIKLEDSITVIGVENPENLMRMKSQLNLFSGYGDRLLFVLVNPSMLKMLSGHSSRYIHYGDFDYAGISIYLHKTKPKLRGESEFFVPENIEQLLVDGDSTKYFQHKYLEKSITGSEEKIDMLIARIRSLQKTAYQEALLIGLADRYKKLSDKG